MKSNRYFLIPLLSKLTFDAWGTIEASIVMRIELARSHNYQHFYSVLVIVAVIGACLWVITRNISNQTSNISRTNYSHTNVSRLALLLSLPTSLIGNYGACNIRGLAYIWSPKNLLTQVRLYCFHNLIVISDIPSVIWHTRIGARLLYIDLSDRYNV